jgi:hypothetical protein
MTDVKKTILARRARFVAAAIASAGLAAGCSSSEAEPQACLSYVAQHDAATDGDKDASLDAPTEAQMCLAAPFDATPGEAQADVNAEPQVCLEPQEDVNAEPQVCLEPQEDVNAEPQVCLDPVPDATPDGPKVCLAPPADAASTG